MFCCCCLFSKLCIFQFILNCFVCVCVNVRVSFCMFAFLFVLLLLFFFRFAYHCAEQHEAYHGALEYPAICRTIFLKRNHLLVRSYTFSSASLIVMARGLHLSSIQPSAYLSLFIYFFSGNSLSFYFPIQRRKIYAKILMRKLTQNIQ